MEQGVDSKRYSVIPRTLIFIFHEDKVLLLQGAKNKKIWAGLYNGIGGHVEPGEDIYSAAIRELEEETGLTQIPLNLAGVIHVDTQLGAGVLISVFRGSVVDTQVKASSEGALHWIPIESIDEYSLVSDLYQLIPIVASWKDGDRVFCGLSQKEGERWVIHFSS